MNARRAITVAFLLIMAFVPPQAQGNDGSNSYSSLKGELAHSGPLTQSNLNNLNPGDCIPNQEADLVGTLENGIQTTITNSSTSCSYAVGIAAYRKFDDTLVRQQIFDWKSATIAPSQTITLSVNLPTCAAQVDVFYGSVILSFAEAHYGTRKLAFGDFGGTNYCVEETPPCVLYAVDHQTNNTSQLLTIDIRNKTTRAFGTLQTGYDLAELALHPQTQALYGVSGSQGSLPGQLYTVDQQTISLMPLGSTGFQSIRGLTFRETDATLWGWVNTMGLIQIDPNTAASTVVFSSTEQIDDIAWNNDSTLLYAVRGTTLWVYTPATRTLTKRTTTFPRGTEALEIRPDGLLLGVDNQQDAITIFAYDATTLQHIGSTKISTNYDVDAIAWPRACPQRS